MSDKSKKRFSIRSLLVIITLMGITLSLRSLVKFDHTWADWVIFTSWLITLWGLSFSVVWWITGKRRLVLLLLAIAMLVMWGPLVMHQIESYLTNSTGQYYIEKSLQQIGLDDEYKSFYFWMVTTGYEASSH